MKLGDARALLATTQAAYVRHAKAVHSPIHTAADAHVLQMKRAIIAAMKAGRAVIDTAMLQKAIATDDRQLAETAVLAVPSAFKAKLRLVLPAVLKSTLTAGGDVGAKLLSRTVRTARSRSLAKSKKFEFDPEDELVQAWIEEHAAELADQLSNTTEEDVASALDDAFEAGELDDLEETIVNIAEDADRSAKIAMNEVMTAVNEGQRQAWSQATDEGYLTGEPRRQWNTADASACPECDDLDGETAAMDESYPGDVYSPPLHPNCRCFETLVEETSPRTAGDKPGHVFHGNQWDGEYVPDHTASVEGEWDRTGDEPRWTQQHLQLVKNALTKWVGDTSWAHIHMADVLAHAPIPSSGSGKEGRKQAEALLWELAHKSVVNDVPLYRGSSGIRPGTINSWSEEREVAKKFAKLSNGRIDTLPAGAAKGLRLRDYARDVFGEKQWIIQSDAKEIARAALARAAGDNPGHAFHGNQYGSGEIHDKHGQAYTVTHDPKLGVYWVGTNGETKGVGGAHLSADRKSVALVGIDEKFQRRGIASALYQHIEQHLGHKLTPSGATTPEGQALWKSRAAGDKEGHDFHGNQWTNAPVGFSDNVMEGLAPLQRSQLLHIANVLKAAATRMDFPHEKMRVESINRNFLVGSKQFNEGGHFNPRTGEIVLDSKMLSRLSGTEAEAILAHEVTHRDWEQVNKALALEGGGGPEMEVDPKLVPTADVVRNILGEEGNQLAHEDGITGYSRAYWDVVPKEPDLVKRDDDPVHPWMDRNTGMLYEKRPVFDPDEDYDEKYLTAVNETLAEIRKVDILRMQGLPPSDKTRPTPRWRRLDEAVKQTAKELRQLHV